MENKRAVLYARVSRDDRAQEGRNLAGQLTMCRQYALERGWRIVAELAEDERGASGADFDLPQLNTIFELAAQRAFDVLVVRELDRLARSLPKQLLIESILAKTDVAIEYVLGVYPNTPEGVFIKNLRAAIAEFERLKTAERTTRARIQAARAGSVMVGSKAPYGYDAIRVQGKIKLRVREDEARIVRLVYEWYCLGDEHGRKLSINDITRKLNTLGVPTYGDARPGDKASRRGRAWNAAAIQRMLRKTEYIGQWHYRKRHIVEGRKVPRPREEQIPVAVPAIVDQALWVAAQVRRDLPRRSKRQMNKSKYLLIGHLWCDICHARMFGRISIQRWGTWRYYGCQGKISNVGSQRCPVPYYVIEVVDKTVWAWVESLLADRATLDFALQVYQLNWDERVAALRGQLAQVQEEIARQELQQTILHDLYLDQELPSTTWHKRNDAFNRKLRALSNEQAILRARLASGNITEPQQARLHEFAGHLLACLHAASNAQATKRYIFDVLKLRVVLGVDAEGNRYAQMSCLFGPPKSPLPPVALAQTVLLPAGQRKRKHDA